MRSKKHLENIRQDDIFIPEWLFKGEQASNKNKIKKIYNPMPLRQIGRAIFKINDEKLANKMVDPYFSY